MKLKTIKQLKSLNGQRVLLRLDLNVSLNTQGKLDRESNWRLIKVLPTIKYLVAKKASVIIVTHLGRPKGKLDKALSLKPVVSSLAKLIGQKIDFWQDTLSTCVKLSKELKPGQLAMLENIRFHRGEEDNNLAFAKQLSQLADIYVNDAFANIHRASASMLGITKYLPSYAGLLLVEEVENLSKIFQTKKGLMVVLGGAKISTKINLLKKFSQTADAILLGGGLANTFLAIQGYQLGKSLVDQDSLLIAKKLFSSKIILPPDVVVARSLSAKVGQDVAVSAVKKDQVIADVGSQTVSDYAKLLRSAKLIVWNGPLGYFENPLFKKNSLSLAKKIAKFSAKIIVGGGETVTMLSQAGLADKFYFVSTGGGAMLAFLENNNLPVLNQLKVKSK